eukprot:Gregarina_sp_Pseudo_9__643@NODE_1409_length_1624_cov_58_675710_g1311_i0_p1_GENE_NODE_1409_length_1624_cov_58_675710_g1311_i0NODE_1409_length_1624_cov_58_675710_g1311_i0_p1_ORF_typecomplete_len414_score113_07IIGP/PF05049_13/6e49MMR_HSR1/PF01926_23/7_3e08FeoB_N/PF02421_18/3_6e06HemX/PF04375_14/7_2e06HemX/PF04375_14/2_2e02RsgA_GTPase/PF03193_16/0_00019RsgA_GTPase/PF03193_16/1_4e03TniB/PF05621_11/2_9TniB/PF05621_11/0_58UPF0242/PF06785_11/0_0007AIG1/PF04548_16/0_0018HOOK/PF05622_12/0_0012HOOK/PF05622
MEKKGSVEQVVRHMSWIGRLFWDSSQTSASSSAANTLKHLSTLCAVGVVLATTWRAGKNETNKNLCGRLAEAGRANRRLKTELQEAQARVAKLGTHNEALREEMAALQSQVDKLKAAVSRSIEPGFFPNAREILLAKKALDYMEDYFHIAVAGCSGTGKSSLINALRLLKRFEPGAAAVGYTETTMKIQRYPPTDPQDKVLWYDIPGAGTLKVPRWDYFKTNCLFMFDAIILTWDNRLLETDVAILIHCHNLRIPCFVVRSKCDQALTTIRQDLHDILKSEKNFAPGTEAYDAEFGARFATEVTRFRDSSQETLNGLCEEEGLKPQQLFFINERSLLSTLRSALGQAETLNTSRSWFSAFESNNQTLSKNVDEDDVAKQNMLDEETFLRSLAQWLQMEEEDEASTEGGEDEET